jgi:hypothetical protein|tara:strand:+ start:356 stop:736 length:381 start_codon:yes stop_codon:yes gene_type:complete
MGITFIISLFSGISFIIYGITSFKSKRMISEFQRWGYGNQRKLIGCFQFIGGAGLIFGSIFVAKSVDNGGALINGSNIIATSSFLLTVLMIAAIFVRIKIKDKLINILPATLYAILNFIVLYNSLF